MPPKRRSDAISRDDPPSASASESDNNEPRRQRQRSSSTSSAASNISSAASDAHTTNSESTLVKKLVRLALSTEYSRTPLRRTDITAKVFKDSNAHGRSFKTVFASAQRTLRDTFGMQLVELPSREKTSLKDRRKEATQTQKSSSTNTTSSKSWILLSVLPSTLKTDPAIVQPTRAPTLETEASYTALYTFILALIYLNNKALTDQKLNRYLKRVNADTYTPFGALEKLLQRMVREGYVEKRRDTSLGEEVVEWVPGPRGKVEVGVNGVAGLVRSVYGYGAVGLGLEEPSPPDRRGQEDEEGEGEGEQPQRERQRVVKIEEDDFHAKLSRSLGIKVAGDVDREEETDGQDVEEEQQVEAGSSRRGQAQAQRSRGRPRRTARDDEED
ncbi:hypothetical protein LTR96_000262 [Exophiala xenobiotica]|nr:hypothetical protein LTR92_001298 [Exophiala xenobiotica]KAK5209471.1 hypothetical protein LTR41_005007 [Exophiala xenobiotica]KAK5223743.1 hypothetical protein LTR72_005129 [Exophiala xenobiotica]KAK5273662.1 hypothetical protein LTR96_000262 [Exophiala xenobiotica]KAK5289144.1 hypothetical protein LTR14_007395 [Exophiala xenobiotica]